jgi:hypothetical protein
MCRVFTSKCDEVVEVAFGIAALSFLLINNPVCVLDHVLVEVVTPCKLQWYEPLRSNRIKLHVVSLVPLIKGAADLHLLVLGTPIVHNKCFGNPMLLHLVEFWDHLSAINHLFSWGLRGTKVDVVQLVKIAKLGTEHLTEDVHRLVILLIKWVNL